VAVEVSTWVWEHSRSRHGARLVMLALGRHGEASCVGIGELAAMTCLMPGRPPLPLPAPVKRDPVPVETRLFVFARDGDRCIRCGSTDDLTIDHKHPRVLGGGHAEDNLQVLCRSCNSRKGARV
jgi:hypothetical protein